MTHHRPRHPNGPTLDVPFHLALGQELHILLCLDLSLDVALDPSRMSEKSDGFREFWESLKKGGT